MTVSPTARLPAGNLATEADMETVTYSNPVNPDVGDPRERVRTKDSLSTPIGADAHDAFHAIMGEADAETKRLKEEQDFLQKKWFGLLYPHTTTRAAYDMFQLFIMMCLAWMLPYRLAFTKAPADALSIAIDWLLDATVWVDIYLNMRFYSYDISTQSIITGPEFHSPHQAWS